MLSTTRKSRIYGTIFVVFLAAAALVAVGCEQQTTQEPATVPATVDVTEPEPVVPTTPEPAPVEPAPSVPPTPPMPPEVPEPEPEPEEPLMDEQVYVITDVTTEKEPIEIELMVVERVPYSDEEYGIELHYLEYLDIGDNPQTFGLDLKGTVFTDTEGAQASVSIAYDNLSDRIEKLADKDRLGVDDVVESDLTIYTNAITKYLEQKLELSVEITPGMLGGLNADRVTYTKDNLKVTHTWAVKDDRVYILTYAATTTTYDESLYLFNGILNSFKFS